MYEDNWNEINNMILGKFYYLKDKLLITKKEHLQKLVHDDIIKEMVANLNVGFKNYSQKEIMEALEGLKHRVWNILSNTENCTQFVEVETLMIVNEWYLLLQYQNYSIISID